MDNSFDSMVTSACVYSESNRFLRNITPPMFSRLFLFLVCLLMSGGAWAQMDVELDVINDYLDYQKKVNEKADWRNQVCNVQLKGRTFTANEWTGICLPFHASKSVLDAVFGADKYEIQQLESAAEGKFVFKKMESPEIVAAIPYIIKTSVTVSNPTFPSVTTVSDLDDSNYFQHVNSLSDFSFRGYYFKKNLTDMYGSDDAHNCYLVTASGELNSPKENWVQNQYMGTLAYFYIDDKNQTPTIQIEGISSGGGGASGGGGETPDPVDPTSLSYKIANRLQLTNAPTIYINLPEIGSQKLEDYLYKDRSTGEAPYRPATIKVVATSDPSSPHYLESFEETNPIDLEIKVRGNSTANPGNNKKAYRLKFAKKTKSSDGTAKKHDLINGGYKKRNWALLANTFDHSMIRNALTYHLTKEMGGMDFMPGYKFVDLVINGDYRGTYQVTDHPEVDGNRINVDEDTGWYVEFQGNGGMLDQPMCFAQDGLQMNIKNPEPEDETNSEQCNAIINPVKEWFLNTWRNGFRSEDCNSANGGWRAVNDEESLLKLWMITEITGDYDGLMTVKAYRETDGKLFWGPVWDKDLAYGNYNISDTKLIHDNGNASSLVNYFKTFLFNDRNLVKKMRDRLQELVTGGLKDRLNDKIDELASLVSETQALNVTKYPLTTKVGEEAIYSSDEASYYSNQLKTWLSDRIDNVLQAYKDQYDNLNKNQLDAAVTYDPNAAWSNNGFNWNGWTKDGNMNKVVDVKETNRSYKAGVWNTFCVPFDLTVEQMTSVFGEYELKVHSAMHSDGETMIFTAPESKNIVAGYPYLLKFTGSNVDNPSFSLVEIVETSNSTKGYNGHYVTFDDKHYFYGTLFTASNFLDTATDCVFADDKAEDNSKLSKTTSNEIKGARAFVRIPSDEDCAKISFTAEAPAPARTQLTDLPTVYIDTDAAVSKSYGTGKIQIIDGNNALTAIENVALEIKGRGTVTWEKSDKKSYTVKFAKADKQDLVKMGGSQAKKKWALIANAGDKTLVRNALTYELGQIVGMPFTPRYRFVDLVLNGTYVGTYQFTDPVQTDDDIRVHAVNEDTDWLLEMTTTENIESGDVLLDGIDNEKPYVNIKNPEPLDETDDAANAVKTPIQTYFDAFWNTLSTNDMDAFKNEETGFRKYIDMESFINWYIATEIMGGYESLSSVYAYKDNDGETKLSFGPLWGNDASYDNHQSLDMIAKMGDKDTENSYNGMLYEAGNQLSGWKDKIAAMWNDPLFAAAVYSRWSQLYNNGELTTQLTDKVDALAAIVNSTQSSQALNFTATESGGAGWSLSGAGVTTVTKGTAFADYAAAVNQLKDYLTKRLPYLEKKFLAKVSVIDLDYDVTLSDAIAKYSTYNGRTANVTLKNRGMIYANEWNGLCLPFDLTASDLTDVFGSYVLRKFKSVTTNAESQKVFNFENASSLEAGKGYIIKPTAAKNLSDYQFNSVELKVVEPTGEQHDGYTFMGTLQKTPLTADKNLYIKRNNQLGVTNIALNAGRAYFIVPEEALSKGFMFVFGDEGTATGIQFNMDDGNRHSAVYNLNGQQVGTSWEMLPRGIYIVNGKKVIK